MNNDCMENSISIANEGNQHAMDGDYQQAVQCYTRAINLSETYENCPNIINIYLNRILCYIKMDLLFIALLDIEETMNRLSPEISNDKKQFYKAKCYFFRSLIWSRLGKQELSDKNLELCKSLKPNSEEIKEEFEKINNQSKEISILKEKLAEFDLNEPTYYKVKENLHLVRADDVPTNIWKYEGVMVKNIGSNINENIIKKHFSLFGDIESLKQSQDNWFISYFNPVTPMLTIGYYQNKVLKQLCKMRPLFQENSNDNVNHDQYIYEQLELCFCAADHQLELEYSRPRFINCGNECYYWRTTTCFNGKNCPKLHIPANKHVDRQLWMIKPSYKKRSF